MEIKINFKNKEDREKIISENSNLYIKKEGYELNEKYIMFTEIKPTTEPTWEEQVENILSILESENADLLLDNAMKDLRLETLENDLADLTLEIAMIGGN